MRMLRWVMFVMGVAAVCAGAGSVLSVSPAVAGNVKTASNSVRVQTARQHPGTGAPVNLCGNTQSGNSCANARDHLAKVLRKRDPGKRVGGKTLVGTRTEAVLRGARGRINFMMALGDRETLIGGKRHDELGAYPGTRGVRINGGSGPDLIHGMGLAQHISGGAGNDLIYGGPGNDTIRGGPGDDTIYGGGGNDRVIDHRGATTVITGPGRARVDVRDGQPNDRVSCPHGSQTRVVADHKDRLSAGCRRVSATAVTSPATGSLVTLSTAGDGSWANPYSTTCGPASLGNCVETFPARTLTGLWANEYVPSYECPFDNSDFGAARVYLIAYNYAPRGTTVPNGVEILGLGPIGVSITLTGPGENQANPDPSLVNMAGQTGTGFGNSSATNWTTGTNSYTPNLHCTNDPLQGYTTLS